MSFGQGRVVVNEFMSWSGCNTSSEYIELLNFGPGPMNIGCYVVTNGQYAVTIPTNTILQPGEYFVLSGRDILAADCGNTDSGVVVDLNWTTCNCTDKPVPTTGDGFLRNGGGANEKIVLMDPSGNVLDAVSRSTPSASVAITTSSIGGACTATTFDLDGMAISYEFIGISTGIDNSYSRRVDGDCGWVKTTAISAGAPNKTGSTSSANYTFTTLNASQCSGSTGSISIGVSAPDLASLFPMTYLLAFDANANNVFEDTDIYSSGSDNSAPSIDIDNLAYGRYRITVGSSSGCNLQSFDFFIFNCYGVLLPYSVISFKADGTRDNRRYFKASIAGLDSLKSIIIEAKSGAGFKAVNTFSPAAFLNAQETSLWAPVSNVDQYRIRLISKSNIDYYSRVLTIAEEKIQDIRMWPNPTVSNAFVSIVSRSACRCSFRITNPLGQSLLQGEFMLTPGKNVIPINTGLLPKGIYQLALEGESLNQRITLSLLKD
ncbi:lamin tail domain-containing protein [Flavitalea sp.]|nr:lamin tail domain-containing protein [Flavitalea sp.]